MADLRNVAEAKADLLEITIGADTAQHHAEVSVRVDYELTDIPAASLGEAPGAVITRRICEGTIKFVQVTSTLLRQLMSLTGTPWHARTIGSQPQYTTLNLHDPQDTDAHGDIYIYRAVFSNLRRSVDGEGVAEIEIDFRGYRDSNGKVWRIGSTA